MNWGWDKYNRLRKYDGVIDDDDYDLDDAIAYPAGRDDLEFTVFASARDTHPIAGGPVATTWPEFVEFCHFSYGLENDRRDKLCAPALIGGRCEGKRANDNIRSLSMICADFDIDAGDPRYRSFDDMVHHLMEQNLSCVAYTTTSNAAGHNRYRVIMPLARNVSPTVWPSVWQAANAKFDHAFDPATKALAGLAFLPRQWTGPSQKGLTGLYNDFASWAHGDPILSVAEIAAIEAGVAQKLSAAGQDHPATPQAVHRAAQQRMRADAPTHTTGELSVGNVSPVRQRLLTNVSGLLVTQWMRDELPLLAGNRTFRFLLAAVTRARDLGYTINASILVELTNNWRMHSGRKIKSTIDLHRQAENAIDFIQNNPQH